MACPNCGAKKGHLGGCNSGAGQKGQRHKKWITITCPTCKGTGKRGVNNCGLCSGTGKIRVPDE